MRARNSSASRVLPTPAVQQRQQVAAPLLDSALEGVGEQAQLAVAADEGRVLPAGDRLRGGIDTQEPVRVDGPGLSLQPERPGGLDLDRAPHEPPRLVADQDLARCGRLLEPCRDVDRVAGCERLPRAP